MQKGNSIWKAVFSSGGVIRHTQRKNGEKSRAAISSINTTGVATLSFAMSTAIISVANGSCAVGKFGNFIYFEVANPERTFVRYKLIYNRTAKTITLAAYEEFGAGNIVFAGNMSYFDDKYVHWTILIPRLFEILFLNSLEVLSAYNIIKKELELHGELVTVDSDAALFILNDYLYESRHEFMLDKTNISFEDVQVPAVTQDLTKDVFGTNAALHVAIEQSVAVTPTINIDSDEFLLVPDVLGVRAELPLGVKIPQNIKRIAKMVKAERDTPYPIRNLLLYGEAGAGKSTAAKTLAHLWGLPYSFMNLSLNAEEGDLLGTYRPIGTGGFEFFMPAFAKAFALGGVIELMEINYARPGVVGVLNSALDHTAKLTLGNGEVISRHKDCIIIATTNVDYAGCQKMSEAVKDRFQQLMEVKKLPKHELAEIVSEQSGNTDLDLIAKMVDAADKISQKILEEGITGGVCSVRQIINWARTVKYTNNILEAAEETVLPGVSLDKSVQKEVMDTILVHMFK